MKKLNKKGFTIVELVIVIAVIAILAAVMIPTFGGMIKKANESAALQTAATAYNQDLILLDGMMENYNTAGYKEYKYTVTEDATPDAAKTYYTLTGDKYVEADVDAGFAQNTDYYEQSAEAYSITKGKFEKVGNSYKYTVEVDDTYTAIFENGKWTLEEK